MATEKKLTHLGVICDGNRRWAKARGLPTLEGHKCGADRVEELVNAFVKTEVEFLSFYLFSTENWNRTEAEISYLMKLVKEKLVSLAKKFKEQNLRFVLMGRPEPVDPDIWQELKDVEADTARNTGKTICFCFNYGGQWEIVDAVNQAIEAGKEVKDPADFERFLYHPEVPACDLIVRSSGEQRISGFQLWRAAYSEFLFLEKNFPDFNEKDADLILEEYHSRHRRFGK